MRFFFPSLFPYSNDALDMARERRTLCSLFTQGLNHFKYAKGLQFPRFLLPFPFSAHCSHHSIDNQFLIFTWSPSFMVETYKCFRNSFFIGWNSLFPSFFFSPFSFIFCFTSFHLIPCITSSHPDKEKKRGGLCVEPAMVICCIMYRPAAGKNSSSLLLTICYARLLSAQLPVQTH